MGDPGLGLGGGYDSRSQDSFIPSTPIFDESTPSAEPAPAVEGQKTTQARDEGVSAVKSGKWARFKRAVRQQFETESPIESAFNKAIEKLSEKQIKDMGGEAGIERTRNDLKLLRSGLSDLQEERLGYIAKELKAALKKNSKDSDAVRKIAGTFAQAVRSINPLQKHEIEQMSHNDLVNRVSKAFTASGVFQNTLLQRHTEIPHDTREHTDAFVTAAGDQAAEHTTRTQTIEFLEKRYTAQITSDKSELERVQARLSFKIQQLAERTTPELQEQRKELQAKVKSLETNIKLMNAKLTNLQNFKNTYKGKEWIGSNDFRDMAKRFALDVGEMNSVAALVNARIHTVSITATDGTQSSRAIHRSGVVADFTEGTKSIAITKQLNDIKKSIEKDLKTPKLTKEKKQELKTLLSFIKQEIASRKDGNTLEELEDKLKEWPVGKEGMANYKEALETLKTGLEAEIAERRSSLQDQFLQLMTTQYAEIMRKAAAEGKPLSSNFVMTQMSLLSQEHIKKMPGFIQNEGVFMYDMACIFQEFQGKAIILDGEPNTGTRLDDAGNIHLNPPGGVTAPIGGITLSTVFFNVAVQNRTDNDSTQKVLNDRAFDRLKTLIETVPLEKTQDELKAKIAALKIKLDKAGGSYEIAIEIMNLSREICKAHKCDCGEAANCFSGKDRTGELLKRIARDELANSIPKQASDEQLLAQYEAILPKGMLNRGTLIEAFTANMHDKAKLRELFTEGVTKARVSAAQDYPMKFKQFMNELNDFFPEYTTLNDSNKREAGELVNTLQESFSQMIPESVPDKGRLADQFAGLLREYTNSKSTDQSGIENKIRMFCLSMQSRAKDPAIEQFNRSTITPKQKKQAVEAYERHLARPKGVARTIAADNIGSHLLKLWNQSGLGFVQRIKNAKAVRGIAA